MVLSPVPAPEASSEEALAGTLSPESEFIMQCGKQHVHGQTELCLGTSADLLALVDSTAVHLGTSHIYVMQKSHLGPMAWLRPQFDDLTFAVISM